MIEIAPWLPHGPVAYAAVRAPLLGDRGFRWFAETDGRPDPDELTEAARFTLRWLDGEGDRPVLLLAFRSGVSLAGALMLAAPERFSGAVLLHGALPLDPPPARGALRGMPILLAHAEDDPRFPQPLIIATRDWLCRRSGAPVRLEPGSGGSLAGSVVDAAGSWLGDRLDYLREHGESALPDGPEPRVAGSRAASGAPRRAARDHARAAAAAARVEPGPAAVGPDRRLRHPRGGDHRSGGNPVAAAAGRGRTGRGVPARPRVRPPAPRRQPAPLPARRAGLRRAGQGLGAGPSAGRRPAERGPVALPRSAGRRRAGDRRGHGFRGSSGMPPASRPPRRAAEPPKHATITKRTRCEQFSRRTLQRTYRG